MNCKDTKKRLMNLTSHFINSTCARPSTHKSYGIQSANNVLLIKNCKVLVAGSKTAKYY